MKKEHVIDRVIAGSIAEELEINAGDILLEVNGNEVQDVFDYHYLMNEEEVTVLIRKPDGEEWELEIEKEYDEDIGIEFASGLMDEYRSCQNKCVFCFIDQMPPGMRDTLYFKDDDSRLSFLQGNYVTLTNMKEKDIERIITYRLEPINISVHTMNESLRCKMLNNRFAGEALHKMEQLRDAEIEMNGQIVICKGINDGRELEYSIEKLIEFIPHMKSVSVVPVGLTKFREGLYPLEPFTKEDAKEVLKTIHRWQNVCMERFGCHFVHAGDEWYLLAEEDFQEAFYYDGYCQLENGVGMMRLLEDEFQEAISKYDSPIQHARKVTLATGRLAAPLLQRLFGLVQEKFPKITAEVVEIKNVFFGEQITVSGLLTGQDILAGLEGKNCGDAVLLPCNVLRSGEEVFLDDMTVGQLKNALQVPVDIVKSSGQDLLNAILGVK